MGKTEKKKKYIYQDKMNIDKRNIKTFFPQNWVIK